MKYFFSVVLAVCLLMCLSINVFAATPKASVQNMLLGTTYQGNKAEIIYGASEGPDQYLLYVPSARTVTFTLIHNDPIGNDNGISGTDGRGDGGFFISINNSQSGSYYCFQYYSTYSVYLPSGYHLISVGSQKYAQYDATYTISAN